MTPLDPAAIETLRRLLAESTPGPWIADFEDEPVVLRDDNEPGRCVVAACEQPQAEYDVELIAHLRNLAPALLEERRRLTDRIAELEESAEWTTNKRIEDAQAWTRVKKELEAQLTAAEQGATALREALARVLTAGERLFVGPLDGSLANDKNRWAKRRDEAYKLLDGELPNHGEDPRDDELRRIVTTEVLAAFIQWMKARSIDGGSEFDEYRAVESCAKEWQEWLARREALSSSPVPPSQKAGER